MRAVSLRRADDVVLGIFRPGLGSGAVSVKASRPWAFVEHADHDRHLDHAGGGKRVVGTDAGGGAGAEVPDVDADVAVKVADHRLELALEPAVGPLALGDGRRRAASRATPRAAAPSPTSSCMHSAGALRTPTSIFPSRPVPLSASHTGPGCCRSACGARWRRRWGSARTPSSPSWDRMPPYRPLRDSQYQIRPSVPMAMPYGPEFGDGDGPFAHLARRGIERAEVAAAVVGVPDRAIAPDLESPGPGLGRRQHELAHRARRRVHAAQLVGAQQRDPDRPVSGRHDAVRHRVRRRRRVDGGLAGLRVEAAVRVVVRVGEPDACSMVDRRMRIARVPGSGNSVMRPFRGSTRPISPRPGRCTRRCRRARRPGRAAPSPVSEWDSPRSSRSRDRAGR